MRKTQKQHNIDGQKSLKSICYVQKVSVVKCLVFPLMNFVNLKLRFSAVFNMLQAKFY